jgi:hypothetical protein
MLQIGYATGQVWDRRDRTSVDDRLLYLVKRSGLRDVGSDDIR